MPSFYQSRQRLMDSCRDALALAPQVYPSDLPPREELLGVPDWYPFEHQAWDIGESIRQSFQQVPRLKRDPAALESVMDVVDCVNLRRGRQSFVMALGFTAAAPLAPRIARFLADRDVDGQVIDTLLKMRVPAFVDAVRPLLTDKHAWIRNLATKYVARYSPAA
jgi:hypothetical protein